jgi:hypothetical protein
VGPCRFTDRVLGQEPNQYLCFFVLAPLIPTPASLRLLPTWLLRRKIWLTILCFLINYSGPEANKLFSPIHEGKTVFYFSVSIGALSGQKTGGFGPILGLFEGTLD